MIVAAPRPAKKNPLSRKAPPAAPIIDGEQLKEDALDLLDWTLTSISPEGAPVSLLMGMESEGHFLPPDDKFTAGTTTESLDLLAKKMAAHLDERGIGYERVYHEKFGAYLIEPTTKPLPAKQAAKNMTAACAAMTQYADELGYSAHFGTMDFPAHAPAQLDARKLKDKGELFYDAEGKALLVGRGQHANVSIQCGDKNAFYDPALTGKNGVLSRMAYAVADEGLNTLPGMALQARSGNYWRIASNQNIATTDIAHARDLKGNVCMSMMTCDDPDSLDFDPARVRIEFRQGAPDAKAADLALSSAIPTVKAVLERAKMADGKLELGSDGLPIIDKPVDLYKPSKMPTTEADAIKLFNPESGANPNFTYLDKLAARKIALCKTAVETGGGAPAAEELRRAEKLNNIGTKLHHHYCQQYGLTSHMPLEPKMIQFAAF